MYVYNVQILNYFGKEICPIGSIHVTPLDLTNF